MLDGFSLASAETSEELDVVSAQKAQITDSIMTVRNGRRERVKLQEPWGPFQRHQNHRKADGDGGGRGSEELTMRGSN